MDARQRADLDNYITGHYGEDQFPPEAPMTAVVYWNDGMVNEWTMAVTGDETTMPQALNDLRDRGKAAEHFWMQWMRVASQLPLTIDPTEPIEAFLARDWGFAQECWLWSNGLAMSRDAQDNDVRAGYMDDGPEQAWECATLRGEAVCPVHGTEPRR